MTNGGSIQLEGLDRLRETLKRLGPGAFDAAMDGLEEGAMNIVADAQVNLRNTAVVAKSDFGFLKAGGAGTVRLTSYGSDEAKYEVESANGGLVVFSEVYYPGWTATVDGELVEVGRVNYVLRAITVKPGNHKVELMFYPKSLDITETIAYVAIGILVLIIILAVFLSFRRKRP